MKLGTYIKHLQELEEKYSSDLKVIYSQDDEGNSFDPVHFAPCAGKYKDGEFESGDEKVNAVCVN